MLMRYTYNRGNLFGRKNIHILGLLFSLFLRASNRTNKTLNTNVTRYLIKKDNLLFYLASEKKN